MWISSYMDRVLSMYVHVVTATTLAGRLVATYLYGITYTETESSILCTVLTLSTPRCSRDRQTHWYTQVCLYVLPPLLLLLPSTRTFVLTPHSHSVSCQLLTVIISCCRLLNSWLYPQPHLQLPELVLLILIAKLAKSQTGCVFAVRTGANP